MIDEMENKTALDAVRKILDSDIPDAEKAKKIVSQMKWYPGVDSVGTWEAVIEMIMSRGASDDFRQRVSKAATNARGYEQLGYSVMRILEQSRDD